MRPGPVFILTFEAPLYRCPSSNLKGMYGLVGFPQMCQTSQACLQSLTFSPEFNMSRRCFETITPYMLFLLPVILSSKMDRMFYTYIQPNAKIRLHEAQY